ncbi:lasso peptide biosynthesis PqqD family chaperone [Rossellomorea arthrocnemi]
MIGNQESMILCCRVSIHGGSIESNMGGERVLLNVENGKYYNLGEVGGVIWDCLKSSKTIEQTISILLDEYDVEPSICEENVLTFLHSLEEENLIAINND